VQISHLEAIDSDLSKKKGPRFEEGGRVDAKNSLEYAPPGGLHLPTFKSKND
jgi:hypothetical protein